MGWVTMMIGWFGHAMWISLMRSIEYFICCNIDNGDINSWRKVTLMQRISKRTEFWAVVFEQLAFVTQTSAAAAMATMANSKFSLGDGDVTVVVGYMDGEEAVRFSSTRDVDEVRKSVTACRQARSRASGARADVVGAQTVFLKERAFKSFCRQMDLHYESMTEGRAPGTFMAECCLGEMWEEKLEHPDRYSLLTGTETKTKIIHCIFFSLRNYRCTVPVISTTSPTNFHVTLHLPPSHIARLIQQVLLHTPSLRHTFSTLHDTHFYTLFNFLPLIIGNHTILNLLIFA